MNWSLTTRQQGIYTQIVELGRAPSTRRPRVARWPPKAEAACRVLEGLLREDARATGLRRGILSAVERTAIESAILELRRERKGG